MTSLQPHDLRGTFPAERPALLAWRRVVAAVECGAPVPYDVVIYGNGASVTYSHKTTADAESDAAAMARALGLTDGPLRGKDTVRWQNKYDEWQTTGELWSVWAHLPEPPPADVSLEPIGTRHPQDPNGGGER